MKNARKHKIGTVTQEQTSGEAIRKLAMCPIPFQRDHGGVNTSKKKYLNGPLKMASQIFCAVYVIDERKMYLVDGYHRAEALATEQAYEHPSYPLYLQTYTVQTMDDAEHLYSMFNSLAAAKRANCYFQSGLRKAKMHNKITSPLMTSQGKVTAVQMASGFMGSQNTMKATIAVIAGVTLVDSFKLRHNGEIGGLKGVYVAAAQYCPNKRLVETFVRSLNAEAFNPESDADEIIAVFRGVTSSRSEKTGGSANKTVFELGLAVFHNYCSVAVGKRRAVREESLTLAQFVQYMANMK